MRKLLFTFLSTIVLSSTINAQVWVNGVDKGAYFAATAGYYDTVEAISIIKVDTTGVLDLNLPSGTEAYPLDLILNGGTVNYNQKYRFTQMVQLDSGTLKINSGGGEFWIKGGAIMTIEDPVSVTGNSQLIYVNGNATIVNNKVNYSPKVKMSNTNITLTVIGTQALTIPTLTIDNKAGMSLNLENDITVNGYSFNRTFNVKLNGHTMRLKAGTSGNNLDRMIVTHDSGSVIWYNGLTEGQTYAYSADIYGKTVAVKVNAGSIVDGTSTVDLTLFNERITTSPSYLKKYLSIDFENITTPSIDAWFHYDVAEVVGMDLYNAFYDTANLLYAFGDTLSADTNLVQYSALTSPGYITARDKNTSPAIFIEPSADSLQERMLDSAVIELFLYNETFADNQLNVSNFTINDAPVGMAIDTVFYVDNHAAQVILSFNGTDFDEDSMNVTLSIAADELSGINPLTSNAIIILSYIESHVATLSSLNVSTGSLNPIFESTVFTYTVELPYGTSETPDITVNLTDINASFVIDTALDITSSILAERTSTVTVTAEDGITNEAYSIVFAVALNNDTTLSDLKIGGVTITGFNSTIQIYDVALASGVDSTVTAVANDSMASLAITQVSSIPGIAYVLVTAEDGVSTATYTINITLEEPTSLTEVNDKSINAWPVPAVDILNVSTSIGEELLLIDMLGNVLFSGVATGDITTIDVNCLTNGNYLIRTTDKIRLIQIIK